MVLPKSSSTRKVSIPRLTTSNPDLSLDYVEELLYTSKNSDTTSDLRYPRAASESAVAADELEVSSKSASLSQITTTQKHIYGRPCPDRNQECHYHHQLTQHCHIPLRHCASALNAIKQSYRASGEWIGAPSRWNETHKSCLKTDKKCDIHAALQNAPPEQQRNKNYPDKPRVRGRHSRGTSDQKKRGDDVNFD